MMWLSLVPISVFVCAPRPSGGLLHWTQTSSETSASLAVEISSYVLLASLSASPLSLPLTWASHSSN